MKYLLDTNTCIQYMRGRSAAVRRHVSAHPAVDLCVCSVVVTELEYGAARSAHPAREGAKVAAFLAPYRSLPFGDDAASLYVRHRITLEDGGLMIGHFDLMIAAIALAHGLSVVTHNVGEFSRVPGLTLEDWENP